MAEVFRDWKVNRKVLPHLFRLCLSCFGFLHLTSLVSLKLEFSNLVSDLLGFAEAHCG